MNLLPVIAILLCLVSVYNALCLVDDGGRERCLNRHQMDYCVVELR